MGNQLAKAATARPAELLSDLPNVVYKDTLGKGRLLKTFLCVHDDGGLVVVKVYLKREDSPNLQVYKQKLEVEREALSGLECPHVWPFQNYIETDKSAFLLRQYVFSNLYERISTRPFLSFPEKKWITFQLLYALTQVHEKEICHGDIKCENILVTSWNWVYITDFASFKPTYIPEDNPADFSFYFDTGGSRRCYIAPERFVDGTECANNVSTGLKPAMDIFSMGCVLAELFLEGLSLFDLSQLHAYRRNEFNPSQLLSKIENKVIRSMIMHMIQLDPKERYSAGEYLAEWGQEIFPRYIPQTLHPFYASLLHLDSDARLSTVRLAYSDLKEYILGERKAPVLSYNSGGLNGSQSKHRTEIGVMHPSDKDKGKLIEDARLAHQRLVESLQDTDQKKKSDRGPLKEQEMDSKSILVEAFELQKYNEITNNFEAFHHGVLEHNFKTKGEIELPMDWEWACDWFIDAGHHSDMDGWSYTEEVIETSIGGVQWQKAVQSQAKFRKRKWLRKRVRKSQSLTLLSDLKEGKLHMKSKDGVKDALREGMMILVSLLCSLLRCTKTPSSQCSAINLLCQTGLSCEDETKLQHVVPYLLGMVNQSSTIVRTVALRALTTILDSIKVFPESEDKVFSEYIFPSLALLCSDPEEIVRVQFAVELPRLVMNAHRLVKHQLERRKQLKDDDFPNNEKFEGEVHVLQKEILRILIELTSGSQASPSIIQAVLQNASSLCIFFGRQGTNDFLLPLLITFLNHSDWRIRKEFFKQLPVIGDHVGYIALEAFLFPCIEQAFMDPEEEVIGTALLTLSEMTKRNMLPKRVILNLIDKTRTLLLGDVPGLSRSSVKFISIAASVMTQTDIYAHILPRLADVWKVECTNLRDENCILECLKDTDSRIIRYSSLDVSPSVSNPGPQELKLSPRMAVYSISKTDFMRTPEHSIHSAIRTGPLQNKDLRKAFHASSDIEKPDSTAGSISILNQSSLFMNSNVHKGVTGFYNNVDAQKNLSDAVVDALSTGVSANANPHSYHHAWQPRGILISHLAEHRRAVNKLCVSSEKTFVASASDDGSVKIWDCRKLEKDISFKSRLTYSSQGGRILSCTALSNSDNIASASSNGSVFIWNVEYVTRVGVTEKYEGINKVDQASPVEGAVLCLDTCKSLVVYITQHGVIHAHDYRQSRDAWKVECKQAHGLIKSLVVDPHKETWLATASDYGVISIFDLRFLMCAKQWSHPCGSSVSAMVSFQKNATRNVKIGESDSSRVLISGSYETGLWNLFEGQCEQIFRNLDEGPSFSGMPLSCQKAGLVPDISLSKVDADVNAVNKYLKVNELKENPGVTRGHLALLPLPVGAFMTAGTDRFMRFWHPTRFEHSYIVCGPYKNYGLHEPKRPPVYYKKQIYSGVPTVEEVRSEGYQSDLQQKKGAVNSRKYMAGSNACHEDCILDLALIDTHERIVLSCSRDGIIKAWK